MAEVYVLTNQLMLLKRKFDDVTWEVQNSGKRLAMADTYGHLEPHALYGVHGIHQIMDPWEQGPNYENATCKWCLKRGHHTIQCHQLTQCKLCLGHGHKEDKHCKPAFPCQVHPDHPSFITLAIHMVSYSIIPFEL
jgi:hypothetical protein